MSTGPASPRFGSVITAMVTPFDSSGALDVEGAATLARWLTDHGSDGLVVAGTTGEGPVLTDDELAQLLRAVTGAVTVPVVAGCGSNDTAHTIGLIRIAEDAGVAGALVVTPYYNRPSQAGIAAHFRAVAGATSLPVLVYDIPVRAGRRVERATMLELATGVANIVGVKDASGDPAGSARLVEDAPAGFELYSGDDVLTLPLLAVGAVGAVSVASHWAGTEIGEMIGCFHKGDTDGARALNGRLLPSYGFESSDAFPNPLPAKAALRALGLPAGQCRLPMGPAPAELDRAAEAELARLGRAVPSGTGGAALA